MSIEINAGKLQLPATRATRRIFLRESEDDSGTMLIEQYIYRRDRYRSTSLDFPVPAPMVRSPLHPAILARWNADSQLMTMIGDTLHSHGITPIHIEVLAQSKPGYPRDGDKVMPTLCIDVNAGGTNPMERWSAARRDLTAILDERNFSNVEVEIQDPERFYRRSLFPIDPNHPAVARYESVRDTIRTTIKQRLGLSWQLISLFLVGRTSDVTEPSVVVMVSALTENDWQSLVFRLETIINQGQPSGQRLRVEFMPGTCDSCLPAESTRPGVSFKRDLASHPRIGTSIGVAGEEGGGTLGGYFSLRCHGRTHTGFLTNSHVFAPAEDQPHSAREEYSYYGLAYHARPDNVGRTSIQYFASKDIKATKADVQDDLNWLAQDGIPAQRTRIEDLRNTGESLTKLEARLAQLRTVQNTLQHQMISLQDMPRHLGRNVVSSGRGLTAQRRTLDWAFVETQSSGGGDGNKLPPQSIFDTLELTPRNYRVNRVLVLPDRLQGFSRLQKGQWYFKIGRTTRLTAGICNGTEAYVNIDQPHHLLDSSGMIVERRERGDSEELIIINAKLGLTSAVSQSTFNDSGDSGSLLIDADGDVAGLLWGKVTGVCGPIIDERTRERAGCQYVNAGLVTDIRDVVQSIGLKTRSSGGAPGVLNVLS